MYKNGFTLIELLVVVMMVAILTAIAVPQYRRSMDRAKTAEAMQMLPALFEARERWAIEHQCTWSNGSLTNCDDTFGPARLDIESKGSISGNKITTPNFEYNLVDGKPASAAQACVSAAPVWPKTERNGLKSAKIYYRGDKFSCKDENSGVACDILNATPDGEKYRTGCI